MVMLNAMPQIELDVTENEFRMTVRTMVFVTERVTKAVFPIGEKYTSKQTTTRGANFDIFEISIFGLDSAFLESNLENNDGSPIMGLNFEKEYKYSRRSGFRWVSKFHHLM